MIAVMAAAGNTGRKISEALLASGEQVRALGRSAGKLTGLRQAGADVRTGDITDAHYLTEAFRGADAVYSLLPTDRRAPDYRAQQDREGETIVAAIRGCGVRYVVALSSMGADTDGAPGVLRGLHAQEKRLEQLRGVNVCVLRPVSFFENFYDQLELIKHQGIISDAVESGLAIPMVAASDVARAAVNALRARDWNGIVVRELLGPRDFSYLEAARIIGERVGKPDLAYVQASYTEMIDALVQAGLSRSFAESYVEMARAFNERTVDPQRTPENATPTSFETFAGELAEAYRAM